MGRPELLRDVMAYAARYGLGGTSLRELADEIGTSHRMLLYHFGSREGLLAAVVAANEAHERELAARHGAEHISADEARRVTWRRLCEPHRAGELRLFYELAAMAMYATPGTEQVAEDMVGQWTELAQRAGVDTADMRLDLAVIRGLLLDLLVTGDRVGTDAAFERYIALRHRPT